MVCVAIGALVGMAVADGTDVGGIGVDVAVGVLVGALDVASRLTLVPCALARCTSARAMSMVACASGGVSVCALTFAGKAINTNNNANSNSDFIIDQVAAGIDWRDLPR